MTAAGASGRFIRLDLLDDLPAFAAANTLSFTNSGLLPSTSGLFEAAADGIVRHRIVGPGWEIGELAGGTANTSRRSELFGIPVTVSTSVTVSTPLSGPTGYLATTLPRRMPHMILDARSNDPALGSSLTRPPVLNQRLSLEGDFDRHFRLFVPNGYERDALYVFTPDLMALMIDEAGDFDVELRDDHLFVYARGGFRLQDAATWAKIDRILDIIGAKALDQTRHYADDRVGNRASNIVAPEGTRLRRHWWRTPVGQMLLVVGAAFTAVLIIVATVFVVIAANMPGTLQG